MKSMILEKSFMWKKNGEDKGQYIMQYGRAGSGNWDPGLWEGAGSEAGTGTRNL